MMRNSVRIDLPIRTEKRYIISSSEDFLRKISPYAQRKRFSDDEHVQTIYYNNEEHAVPFDLAIKARRYLPRFPDSPALDGGVYFLDFKKGEGQYKKKPGR